MKDKFAIIDDEDFDLLNQYKWRIDAHGYAVTGKKNIFMHRMIMRAKKGQIIDHINHDTLDNRKINLRFCVSVENSRNRQLNKNNSSGYKGVSLHKMCGKWQARIKLPNKRKSLGLFSDRVEAAKAYNKAAKLYYGEYAYTNII